MSQVANTPSPHFLAYYHLRHRNYETAIALSEKSLQTNSLDQIAWVIKARSLVAKAYIPDSDFYTQDQTGELVDENVVMAAGIRPGTSLNKTTATVNQSLRPVTNSGRAMTGFQRPGTMSMMNKDGAARGFTARMGTALGRNTTTAAGVARLNTASLITEPNGPFIQVDKLDLKKYAARPLLSRVLFEYIFYQENNPRKALELATFSSSFCEHKDWWWKSQIAKCYFRLGLLRDAERHYKASLKDLETVTTIIELGKVQCRLNQPKSALDLYMSALGRHDGDVSLLTHIARVHESLDALSEAAKFYKFALHYENANVEALASLAGNCFYSDQPEVSLIYYRRLLQMGVNTPEIWNNIGTCCFYGGQYDLSLSAFSRALSYTHNNTESTNEDDSFIIAHVYYNLGHVATCLGDLSLAHQCWKVSCAVSYASSSTAMNLISVREEAETNINVLEGRKAALSAIHAPGTVKNKRVFVADGKFLFESFYNAALAAYKAGDYVTAFENVERSLKIYPEHEDGIALFKLLAAHYAQC